METQTGGTFQDILDILTGRKKPTASVETTVNIGVDPSAMVNLALTVLLAGTVLIVINIYAQKFLK